MYNQLVTICDISFKFYGLDESYNKCPRMIFVEGILGQVPIIFL
jgi:hypothetical protein